MESSVPNCHDSHGSRNLVDDREGAATNALCLTCHGPGKHVGPDYKTLSDHTHHAALVPAADCIECHYA